MVSRGGGLGAEEVPLLAPGSPPPPPRHPRTHTHTWEVQICRESHVSAACLSNLATHLSNSISSSFSSISSISGLSRPSERCPLSLLLQEDGGHQENRARGQQETLRHARDACGWSCVHVRHVRCWSQVSVMCDDHYCHTPAPLPQLTLPMQMSLIASPSPPLTTPPSRCSSAGSN